MSCLAGVSLTDSLAISKRQGLGYYPSVCRPCFQHNTTSLFFFFLAVLCLRCCTRAFSSCSEQGLLFVAVRGLLIAVASLVAEHGL